MYNVHLAKLRKQPDSTWALLQRRLISIPEPFEKLFPAPVWSLIHSKSNALSTNAGYVSTNLITTTAFLAGTGSILHIGPQEIPLNIYSIFVGPPTTGESQVIKQCTSSGLVKTVAEEEKGFLLSAEIYDILYKLLKSDEENTTGDGQVLCQMFSGEEASYRYATERVREIRSNMPFCILGATQAPFAARLVTILDQGHGLLEWFFITFPKCLRPTPQETEQAVEAVTQSPLLSFDDIFLKIARLHASHASYTLNSEAHRIVNVLKEEFIADVNEAITEGRIPPKTKKTDCNDCLCFIWWTSTDLQGLQTVSAKEY